MVLNYKSGDPQSQHDTSSGELEFMYRIFWQSTTFILTKVGGQDPHFTFRALQLVILKITKGWYEI